MDKTLLPDRRHFWCGSGAMAGHQTTHKWRLIIITLLGSFIGFMRAAFPDFFKMWRDTADCKHELTILEMQMAQQEKGHAQRLEEINVQADISESPRLIQNCTVQT